MSSGNSNDKNSPKKNTNKNVGKLQPPSLDDNKTVFKSSKNAQSAKKIPSEKTQPEVFEQETIISTKSRRPQKKPSAIDNLAGKDELAEAEKHDYGAALTQIQKSIRDQDSSTGFLKAKQAANKALAEDKIILNKRFVLEETLGAGGMGTVYRARDLRKVEANDLQPNIAVKVLNDEFKNHPDAFVTLQREASRSHTLSHPNIVTVHDFDRDDDIIYMTMELLEGVGLEVLMRQNYGKGFPKNEAFNIIADIGTALSYAHEKDIVHSDLKPGNIFITPSGAKVLDFGIARVANENALDDFDAGSLGALTPAYASLEMINCELPDASDDVFAAAIIAYELLSGQHPYDRKSADVALAENLRPQKIKGLNKKEWKALENALEIKRKNRTSEIKSFVQDLTHKNKIPIFKISSAILFIIAAVLIYYNVYAPDPLNEAIKQNYSKAEECFSTQDYSCSIESSRAVIKMAPDHQAAKGLLIKAEQAYLAQKIDTLVQQANSCLTEQNILCVKNKLLTLKNTAPNAQEISVIDQAIKDFERNEKITALLNNIETCFNEQDYPCALKTSKQLLTIAPNNPEAKAQHLKVQDVIKQQTDAEQENNRLFNLAKQKAQKCFDKKDYNCAINSSQQALKYKPNNNSVLALKQSASFAQHEQQQNLKKADRLITKAQKCFAKKNYSCTIANAESALEFIPKYPPAISLRDKAQQEVESLKNSISIE